MEQFARRYSKPSSQLQNNLLEKNKTIPPTAEKQM